MKSASYIKLFRHPYARYRLLISIAVAAFTSTLLPAWMLLPTRIISIWDAGAICFLVLAWAMMNGATSQKMQLRAQCLDDSRLTILILVVASACASLLAITFMLKSGKNIPEWILILHVALAVLTIVVSWLLTHTTFALHYAYSYYRDRRANSTADQAEGLDFPGDHQPDYWDFLYFSFVIGMTCQVSDVQIASRSIRRLALVHGVLTFFFNTVILALSINIIAGLV